MFQGKTLVGNKYQICRSFLGKMGTFWFFLFLRQDLKLILVKDGLGLLIFLPPAPLSTMIAGL